jgi:hypothetical protein
MFLQLSQILLFGKKRADLHLEKCKLSEIFLSNTNEILMAKNLVDPPSSNTDGFL